VRTLASADQPGPLGPVGEVDLPGQLGDARPVPRLAVLIYRPPKSILKHCQRFAHRLVERIAEREANVTPAAKIGELVAGAGGVRASEDLAVKRTLGQLPERQVERLAVILGVVGARISRPQNPSQHLPAAADQ
jgi:hypothetical protein